MISCCSAGEDADTPGQSWFQIFCCGEFSLFMDDEPVYLSQRKAYEMLAYLIMNNGRPTSKYRISSQLWEDSEDACARDSLYKTYAYLKKTVNQNGSCAVGSVTNKLFLNKSFITCDLWEFERLYSEKSLENWEKAEKLYKGPLFGGEAYSWLLEYEGRYEMMYYEILAYLLSYYETQHRAEKVKYYKKKLCLLEAES